MREPIEVSVIPNSGAVDLLIYEGDSVIIRQVDDPRLEDMIQIDGAGNVRLLARALLRLADAWDAAP